MGEAAPAADRLAEAEDRLRSALRDLGSVVVAFSGGADSAYLAWVARDELGVDRARCVTAVSPSLAGAERADCEALAREWGLLWTVVETDEMARPEYVANGADRCYHCKAELLDVVNALTDDNPGGPGGSGGGATVVLGVNTDDLGDHRPGQRAAAERGARFPLVEAGFSKADVREASRRAGLRTWDKPAAACLSSRLPYGTPVTIGTLGAVERAEAGLHALGLRQIRVRHHGDVARVEVDPAEMADAFDRRAEVVSAVRAAGYRYVSLDLDGFRSGSLNEVLVSQPTAR